MKPTPKKSPWFERPHVTVAEAAIVLHRSRTWVRNKIVSRALEAVCADEVTPTCVTTRSIMALIDRAAHDLARCRPDPLHSRKRQYLQLVVDNTK